MYHLYFINVQRHKSIKQKQTKPTNYTIINVPKCIIYYHI